MSVSTWLLSLLEREYRLLGDAFPAKYPGPWIIWEPGEWRPARTMRETNQAQTLNLAKTATPARPVGTDAFCFQLGFGQRRELIVGRASESDVLINDLTLSRTHLLVREGAACVAPGCSNETRFDGVTAAPGEWCPLTDGLSITTGAMRLTYLESVGMLNRLSGSARRRGAA